MSGKVTKKTVTGKSTSGAVTNKTAGTAGSKKLDELRKLCAKTPLNVISGPTAVGKGTVSAYLKQQYPDYWVSVSYTTRNLRPKEIEGVHYHHVDEAEFQGLIERDGFLEWAQVHNSYLYGTPLQELIDALKGGKHVVLEIDLQGARIVRGLVPESRLIFLAPPDFEDLIVRQKIRDTESYEERQVRLDEARIELAAQGEFDFVVINDKVERAAKELERIIYGRRTN